MRRGVSQYRGVSMEKLHTMYTIAENPGEYLRGLKKNKGRILGYFCSYAPEEIILAADVHPVRLFGTRDDISLADAHLQSYCCSLVRGALEDVLRGNLDFLDGAVFPHTCDSIQRLSDLWRLNTDFPFFADLVLPVTLDRESSRQYMVDVLKKFKGALEIWLEKEITEKALLKSIATYNRISSLLGTLYQIRSDNTSAISGRDLYTIVKASMIMKRHDLLEILPKIVERIQERAGSTPGDEKKRLVLTGSICQHPDIYEIIEDAGGTVVGDDLCTGSRYFEGAIDEEGDPLEAITKRYMERPICPAKHLSLTARADHIIKTARENRADGVIFLLLKFCDPHAFDYPYIKNALNREDIPNALIEVEAQLSEGQIRTRLETFIAML